MTKIIENFWILLFLGILGCANTSGEPAHETRADQFQSMNPNERHIWLPPSEDELEERRRRQKELDAMAADLERLYMKYADLLGDELVLENQVRATEPQLLQLEAQLKKDQDQRDQQAQAMKQALEKQGTLGKMKTYPKDIQKQRAYKKATLKVRKDDYRLAILLFRNGKYRESIAKFKNILENKYAPNLKDNILFGLASNFYRLKEYDQALSHLEDIIRDHPKGDKWLVSHTMSGLIYNIQGKYGKAVSILESALQHQPNPNLLKIINRLLRHAKEGSVDASS